jgi:hypothetical protein
MILVPKIGPHGLFVPATSNLILQVAVSIGVPDIDRLVRIFRKYP